MSRRKAAPQRKILPDPLFSSDLLAKFINAIMKSGKKSIAEKIVYDALDRVVKSGGAKKASNKKEEDGEAGGSSSAGAGSSASLDIRTSERARELALEAFKEALANVTPVVEVRSRRVGGSTYQVPVEVRPKRKMALAMRWLSEYAAERSEKTMSHRLANEILAALDNQGAAVKKKQDVHRMAEANKAFSHYRW
ncbi:MAG: 30S ribosomal protein S7 [Gammaproteobacteria bacterium RIFCSPHIGHO2_12_FULL_41_15]|nr:MAG: 30S ribosomal protein S7 [Gammaproteobacteria bacterium RIFCSPHIGHO2_12_FULL_41_15]